ncbi:hypothetical protein A9R05_41590 (plasmid) [Burkholderia sp. KK1]|uniref:Uncharacterized protein n=1 Tax=Burkholderia sp. M701 TaxID=326454 RepID=V5YNF9_9BURK|nr:hypothetical protein [Burkholderia sp. M701]AQH05524.1 hypothetical protein A9R05_41590 [Burkholderia sp. KK1]BAO18794.1 hypothetical protein [Burkholderia sp. M701]
MSYEHSPIEIGLDAMGVGEDRDTVTAFSIAGKPAKEAVAVVAGRMKKAMKRHPEIGTDILMAGLHVMLDQAGSIEDVQKLILPRLESAADMMAA